MTPERGWQDSDRAASGAGASEHARDRLGAEMSSEVAATRAAWADALLRSDAALRRGSPEEARRALDDQRQLLVQLQRRLDRVVASALVEREAEQAVSSGLAELDASRGPGRTDEIPAGAPGDAPGDSPSPSAPSPRGHRLPRALAGTAAAVLVALVATVAGGTPPPTPEIAAMDEAAGADDAGPEELELPGPADGFDGSTAPADELRGLGPWTPSDPETAEDAPESDDRERRPADAAEAEQPPSDPDGPRPADEPDPDAARTDDGGEDRRPTSDGTDGVDEADHLDETDETDGADDGEDGEEAEGLRDRLPRLDRSLAQRIGEQLEELWAR